MDETALRELAGELLTELPAEIPDPTERTPIADAIAAALAVPPGGSLLPLIDALSEHEATRRWMRDHGAARPDAGRRRDLDGHDSITLPNLNYECPHKDEDKVLLSIPARPPRCSKHDIPMNLVQD